MSKIELLPDSNLPKDASLYARTTRKGTILCNTGTNKLKKRKAPIIATELSKAKDCLKAARTSWGSLDFSVKSQFIDQMPILCELRFPSNKRPPSNFNRYLNLYAGYYFGNYYNNGNLSIDFEGSPLELTSILYDLPNPNPAMYGDFLMGFNYDTSRFYNLVFSNLSINLYTNKISFSITYDFDVFPWESIDTLSFGFSSPSNSVGLCFYISNPKSAVVTPFWIQHRLIIASFPPFTNTILPSPLDPDGIFDFTGNLAKYHQLSTLDLPSGATVDITIFSVSVYGQSHRIGTFPATIE